MANGPKVEILLNTTATGTGVEDTVAGLDRLEKKATAVTSTVKLPGADPKTAPVVKQTSDALEKEAASAEKAARQLNEVAKAERAIHQEADTGRAARRDVSSFLERAEDHARATTIAFYDLDKALTATGNTSNQVPAKLGAIQKPARDNATALLMMSQGLEDAQYGIRGVLNNIPGLVMALGGGAGLAGGISIAAVALSSLVGLFGKGKEEAEAFEADLADIAEKYSNSITDRLDERSRKRQEDQDVFNRKPDPSIQAAEDKAFQARQDNIDALLAATQVLNDLMGRQVAAQETIAAAEAERARKREEEQQREIDAAKQVAAAAQVEARVAEQKIDLKRLDAMETKGDLQRQQEALDLLRKQRDELEKIIKMPMPALTGGGGDATMAAGASAQRQQAFTEAMARRVDAQEKLEKFTKDNEGFEQMLTKSIDNLEARAATEEKAIQALEKAAEDAAMKAGDISTAAQENIKTIVENGQIKQATDAAATATEADAAMAKQVRAAVEMVDNNAKEQRPATIKAADSLKEVMSDNTILLSEIPKVITAMQTIQANFRGDISRMMSVTEQAVALGNANAARLLRLEQLSAQGAATLGAPRRTF